jgi:uncharacterized membrane protein
MKTMRQFRSRRSAVGRPSRLAIGRSLHGTAAAGTSVVVLLIACACMASVAPTAGAAVATPHPAAAERGTPEKGGSSLEAAATKAGDTGRAVAMSLIGLAFAVAATVLAFRRDFKEAAGVFAVGLVSVLLATPAGVNLLRDTVKSVFGGQ